MALLPLLTGAVLMEATADARRRVADRLLDLERDLEDADDS